MCPANIPGTVGPRGATPAKRRGGGGRACGWECCVSHGGCLSHSSCASPLSWGGSVGCGAATKAWCPESLQSCPRMLGASPCRGSVSPPLWGWERPGGNRAQAAPLALQGCHCPPPALPRMLQQSRCQEPGAIWKHSLTAAGDPDRDKGFGRAQALCCWLCTASGHRA